MARLTTKQQLFANEYIVDLNATQAAIRAGYSKRTAGSIGHELLKKPEIQGAIQEAMDERAKRTEITADLVLQELRKIATADIKDLLEYRTEKTVAGYDEDGQPVFDYRQVIELKPSDQIDGALVQEVKLTDNGTLSLKVHDKLAALDKLARHLGIFDDKLTLSGQVGINNPFAGLTTDELRGLVDKGE